jgi:hypothetical protein
MLTFFEEIVSRSGDMYARTVVVQLERAIARSEMCELHIIVAAHWSVG